MQLPGAKAMHTVGQIASHNTNLTSDWTSHLANVNAVELDVWPRSNWRVSHAFDVGAGTLAGYMKDLKNWRAAHKNHDLLTIFIEIKSKEGWRVPDFEELLLSGVDRNEMFTPKDLADWGNKQGGQLPLRWLVRSHGWPTFAEVKGKVMFVVNNNGDHVVDTYLAERPLGGTAPICFVMSSLADRRKGWETIVIFNGEYAELAMVVTVPPRAPSALPADHCLRRAYSVPQGNDEMVRGDTSIAAELMKKKLINYLAYDETKNAFWTDL
jgi:hypothetical protein